MKKILIVNSNEKTLQLLEMWLERRRYDVKFTTKLDEVVGIMDVFNPDLMMIDLEQREIIPAVKSHNGLVPLLLMAGYAYKGSYSDFPAENIIEKPFTLSQLQQKVDRLMKEVVL